jgi:tryptophanase
MGIERFPWMKEQAYLSSAPNTPGMMTNDQRVILSPQLQGQSRDSVRLNELIRLRLRNYQPTSQLNQMQQQMFRGTPYENDPQNAMRSVIARQVSGDPSANIDFTQDAEIRKLQQLGGLLPLDRRPMSDLMNVINEAEHDYSSYR